MALHLGQEMYPVGTHVSWFLSRASTVILVVEYTPVDVCYPLFSAHNNMRVYVHVCGLLLSLFPSPLTLSGVHPAVVTQLPHLLQW